MSAVVSLAWNPRINELRHVQHCGVGCCGVCPTQEPDKRHRGASAPDQGNELTTMRCGKGHQIGISPNLW